MRVFKDVFLTTDSGWRVFLVLLGLIGGFHLHLGQPEQPQDPFVQAGYDDADSADSEQMVFMINYLADKVSIPPQHESSKTRMQKGKTLLHI